MKILKIMTYLELTYSITLSAWISAVWKSVQSIDRFCRSEKLPSKIKSTVFIPQYAPHIHLSWDSSYERPMKPSQLALNVTLKKYPKNVRNFLCYSECGLICWRLHALIWSDRPPHITKYKIDSSNLPAHRTPPPCPVLTLQNWPIADPDAYVELVRDR